MELAVYRSGGSWIVVVKKIFRLRHGIGDGEILGILKLSDLIGAGESYSRGLLALNNYI